MNKLTTAASLAAALSCLPVASGAQDRKDDSPHTLTANMSLVSEYRYRGIAQSDFKPAVQAGIDYGHASGIYLGTWASSISWLSDTGLANNSLEWDFYGGWKRSYGDFGVDVGVLHYFYPGTFTAWQAAGNPKPNTTEVYVAGSWKMLSLKYSHAVTDIFGFPDSDGSNYVDLGANFDVGAGFTVGAHYGRQKIKTSVTGVDCSYNDWKVGVGKEIAGFTVGLNYVDTDAKDNCYTNYRGKNLGKGTVVLSVGRTF